MYSYQPFSRPLFYGTVILSILVCLLSIVVLVLIGALGFSGVNGGTPISVVCTTAYYLLKLSDLTLFTKVTFYHSLIAAVVSIVVVVVLMLMVKKLRGDEYVKVNGVIKLILYLGSSLVVYCSIVTAGYYLTFRVQLDQCTSAYNSTYVLVLAILSGALVCLALILWILLFFIYWKVSQDRGQKYKQVRSSQTQPNDQVQPVRQVNETRNRNQEQRQDNRQQDVRQQRVEDKFIITQTAQNNKRNNQVEQNRYKNNQGQRGQIHEHTHENLYDSPSRKPIFTYNKQPESRNQQPVNNISYLPPPQSKSRVSHMPVLEARDSPSRQNNARQYNPDRSRYQQQSRIRGSPQESHVREQPQQRQGLMFHKERRRSPEQSKYMDSLLKESKQYLNRHGVTSVLDNGSGSGIQQRQSRGSDFMRSGNEPPPRSKNSSQNRQGVLLNYIRGKYAG